MNKKNGKENCIENQHVHTVAVKENLLSTIRSNTKRKVDKNKKQSEKPTLYLYVYCIGTQYT